MAKTATVEVIVDARPINLPVPTITASSLHTIAARALKAAKPKMRRGAKHITIRLSVI